MCKKRRRMQFFPFFIAILAIAFGSIGVAGEEIGISTTIVFFKARSNIKCNIAMFTRKNFIVAVLAIFAAASISAQVSWYSPFDNCGDEPFVCGRAWNKELGKNFVRLPNRYQGKVTSAVWGLSRLSAGISLRFFTNSKNIRIRYVLAHRPGYLNMAWLNHSGIDLYGADANGKLHWIGNHMNWKISGDTATIAYTDLSYPSGTDGGTEFRAYLPPYNEVSYAEVGVDNGVKLEFRHEKRGKPIVVYGSSIVNGASPSRPGLMFTNIVARESGWPVVNLGFSGSAFMEPAVFDFLSEIDARAFILDPIPNSYNMSEDEIVERACNGVRKIRQASDAPILMVESCVAMDTLFRHNRAQEYFDGNRKYRAAYEKLRKEGVSGLYYLPAKDLKFTEESMIEGTHPNDFGNREYADAYLKAIKKMLGGKQAKGGK